MAGMKASSAWKLRPCPYLSLRPHRATRVAARASAARWVPPCKGSGWGVSRKSGHRLRIGAEGIEPERRPGEPDPCHGDEDSQDSKLPSDPDTNRTIDVSMRGADGTMSMDPMESLSGFGDIWRSSSSSDEGAGGEMGSFSCSPGNGDGASKAPPVDLIPKPGDGSPQEMESSPPSSALPKPLYLLSIRVESSDVENNQLRQDIVAKSFKSGLVNAVMVEDSDLPSRLLLKPASRLREICDQLGLPMLVENRVDLAVNSKADGVLLDQGLDLASTRVFLDLTAANQVENVRTLEEDGSPPSVLCGRIVYNAEEALAAEEENVDLIMVALPKEGEFNERELRMELRSIRRATSAHVVATHGYCMQAGGPKMVFSAGADGLQIPAQKLYKLILEQVSVVSEEMMKELPPAERVFGATFLIAGGTVGAGIIALPVKTAAAGFIPSMAAMACCWLFMVTTASLLLELSLWWGPSICSGYGPGANLTTMADKTLGSSGKMVVTALYLFIYGATLCAYMAEGARFLDMGLAALGVAFPMWCIVCAFSLVFGGVLFAGPNPTDKVNTLCLVVALAAYALLLKLAAGTVIASNLLSANWNAAPAALPVMVVAFTFHNIVPSLLSYLGSSERVMKAIVMGSGIPFVMYFIWELVILGTIPPGVSLTSANQIIEQIGAASGDTAIIAVKVFSAFAIITSFLGVGLGCIDFIQDLLMKEKGPFAGQVSGGSMLARLVPLLCTMTPPLLVACAAPHIFFAALEFSGAFRLILFGILPVLMAWKGRYILGKKSFVIGGKPVLGLILCVAFTVLSVDWGGRLGLIARFA